MKYIAKMMLALLASVTLVIPAYAWDFSASGSLSSTFNQTSEKSNKDADAISSMDVGSEGGAITLKSSHSEGDKSATFSFVVTFFLAGFIIEFIIEYRVMATINITEISEKNVQNQLCECPTPSSVGNLK